ncbi:hypothetical protein MBLNU230_g5632t1 [Neophaeotheca triangularis]
MTFKPLLSQDMVKWPSPFKYGREIRSSDVCLNDPSNHGKYSRAVPSTELLGPRRQISVENILEGRRKLRNFRAVCKPATVCPLPVKGKLTTFFDLPAEIRNNIYTLAVVTMKQDQPVRAQLRNIRQPHVATNITTLTHIVKKRLPAVPGIAQANSQLRNEARSVYFSENSFTFSLPSKYALDNGLIPDMTSQPALSQWSLNRAEHVQTIHLAFKRFHINIAAPDGSFVENPRAKIDIQLQVTPTKTVVIDDNLFTIPRKYCICSEVAIFVAAVGRQRRIGVNGVNDIFDVASMLVGLSSPSAKTPSNSNPHRHAGCLMLMMRYRA